MTMSVEDRPVPHLIDGEETPALSGKTFVTVDPATGVDLARVAFGGVDDVERAVAAAAAAHRDRRWSGLGPGERAELLRAVGRRIRERADDVAEVESVDTGKPIAQARAEIHGAADGFEYYAGLVEQPVGAVYPADAGRLLYSRRIPYGVVAAISPWNYPFHIAAHKVAPALAAGNTVVLKAAEQTPLSAMELGRAVRDAGVPPGVLNVLHGDGRTTGAALVEHPEVTKITFTGSTATGRAILHAAADQIKSVHLELGGKSPNVVFDDADLDRAVDGALFTAFNNAGQVCTSGSRLLVQRGVAGEFVERLVERASGIVVGAPADPGTQMGPLVSREHQARVASYVDTGVGEGAVLALDGSTGEGPGYFMGPTVFLGVRPSMRIAQEEIFGPVLSVIEFDTEEEAVQIANDVMYGLAAAVWTRDLGRAMRMSERIDAGIVWTNCTQYLPVWAPYEGHKGSGLGEDQGLESLREFTRLKTHAVDFGSARAGR